MTPWLALADRFAAMPTGPGCPYVALAVERSGLDRVAVAMLLGLSVDDVDAIEARALRKFAASRRLRELVGT